MNPIGRQKKIDGSQHAEALQKLIDGGGAKPQYGGNRNMSSGTKTSKSLERNLQSAKSKYLQDSDDMSFNKLENRWQGTVKGATKHTYKGE